MFKIGFLCPKREKEMEKGKVRRKKTGFGAGRNGLQANHLLKWNCLLLFLYLFLFFSIFKWLLMLTMLSNESCYNFSYQVLVAYINWLLSKKSAYKNKKSEGATEMSC